MEFFPVLRSIVRVVCWGCILPVAAGCVSQRKQSKLDEFLHCNPDFNSNLFEIVTLTPGFGPPSLVVLTRADIVDALDNTQNLNFTDISTNIFLTRDKLFAAWLPGRWNTRKNRDLAEARLSGCTVRRFYSLAELNVSDPDELLNRFFTKPETETDPWWEMKSDTLTANRLRESDFIATLKTQGFEVMQGGDIVRVLLVRRIQ